MSASSPEWTIASVTPEQHDDVLSFIAAARKQMFSQLSHTLTPDNTSLLSTPGSSFFSAQSSTGQIIGVIGFIPYDFRFPQFSFQDRYRSSSTVEVVRLFVLPEYRSRGVAGALWEALDGDARRRGVEVMYLHTHPWLEGAEGLWERRGFGVVVREEGEWGTIHMERRVGEGEVGGIVLGEGDGWHM